MVIRRELPAGVMEQMQDRQMRVVDLPESTMKHIADRRPEMDGCELAIKAAVESTYAAMLPTGMTKACRKCGTTKRLDEFSRDRRARDGRQSACKFCNRAYAEANKDKIAEKKRAYEGTRRDEIAVRMRAYRRANKSEIAEKNRIYREANKGKRAAHNRTHAERHPQKARARNALNHAVHEGHLTKPTRCEDCGEATESRLLHGHHADYSKPLDVKWLCHPCHFKRHSVEAEAA